VVLTAQIGGVGMSLRWFLAAALAIGGSVGAGQESPRIVRITAERFDFSPSEIALRVGEEVEFHITSEDTSHGFHIADTPVTAAIPKRGQGEAVVRFRPERAGRYTFECNRMCGAGHDFMRGIVRVEGSEEQAR
jgi:cytochrome c oxidase subunit 2